MMYTQHTTELALKPRSILIATGSKVKRTDKANTSPSSAHSSTDSFYKIHEQRLSLESMLMEVGNSIKLVYSASWINQQKYASFYRTLSTIKRRPEIVALLAKPVPPKS